MKGAQHAEVIGKTRIRSVFIAGAFLSIKHEENVIVQPFIDTRAELLEKTRAK